MTCSPMSLLVGLFLAASYRSDGPILQHLFRQHPIAVPCSVLVPYGSYRVEHVVRQTNAECSKRWTDPTNCLSVCAWPVRRSSTGATCPIVGCPAAEAPPGRAAPAPATLPAQTADWS